MNGNNNNKKPGMGNQNPMERKPDMNRPDTNKGGNRPQGNDYKNEYKKPSNPGNPGSSYKPDIRGGNDKMKGDKCPDCGQYRSNCTC